MILADVDADPVGIDRVGTVGSAVRCGSGNGIHRAGGRLLWLLEARLQDPWPARSPSRFFSDAALHRVGESLKGSVEDRGWGRPLKVVQSVSRILPSQGNRNCKTIHGISGLQ